VAGVNAAAGVGERDEVGKFLSSADRGPAFAGKHQHVVLREDGIGGVVGAHEDAFGGCGCVDDDSSRAWTAVSVEEVDAACAAGVGELALRDAHLEQDALDLVDGAGGDGDLGNVSLGLVLRHVHRKRGIGTGGGHGDLGLDAPSAGDGDDGDGGADGDVGQNELAIDAGGGADDGRT